MKKLNKLFAILFAVLGVTTLKAQTDVTSQYLKNANFSSTDGWTQHVSGSYKDIGSGNIGGKLASYAASSTDATHLNSEYFFGFQCRWDGNYSSYNQETSQALPSGVYTLSYDVENVNGSTTAATYNNLFYVKVGEKTLSDASTEWMKGKSSWTSHSITFLITDPTKVTVSLGYGTGSNNFHTNNTPVLYVSHLKLTYRGVDDINAENPADFTSLIKNPSFETGNLDGWTYKSSSDTGVKPNSDNTYKTSGVDGNYLYNTWWQGTPLTQTVGNIPNGIYELKVLLASDENAKLFLLANDEHSEVYTITTDNKTFHDVSYEFKVLNGQAKIGVVGGNDAGEYVEAGHWWYKADNFRLIYKGADLSIEREAMDAALAKARAIDQATIPTVVAVSLNSAISTAENVENALNPIKAATNALLAVLATVDVVQAPYIETKALITSSNNMLTNSTASDADKATFQGVINKAEENLNDATDKATIDAIAVTIIDAQKAYCLVASPTEGHPFDMTHLIVNPKFDQDKTGWNSDGGAQNKTIASNKPEPITGKFYENWNPDSFTGSIYQETSGWPNGTYKLKAAAFGNNAVLFANDATTQMADNDNTPAWYEVEVKVSGGTLKFGVRNNNNTNWMGIDNVSLLFISGFDLSEFEAAYNTALEAAIAARDNADYNSVAGIERTNLVNAINLTVEETKESYMEATSALNEATAAFIAAKSDYETLNSEITIAKGLGMTEDAINAVTSGKTGALAYTDLKVAEYTYIMDTYTAEVQIGAWTENFDELNGEGYDNSGTYYFDFWGSDTRSIKQTVTLPTGDYAISVIARGQEGASGYLYYKLGDEEFSVDLIMKGAWGYGVDIDGKANFSEDGTYKRDDNSGFGWEYRFLTFHLDAETEVEFGVSATVNQQWASAYAPKLFTTLDAQKTLLQEEIASLLANLPEGKMNVDVKAILDEKAGVAENVGADTELEVLNEVAGELRAAVSEAKASIAAYEAINRYITKANAIDESIAAEYLDQYENGTLTTAEPVFQSLEVATYKYVTTEFSYPVELSGEWTTEGPVGELSDQHWSGEKRPYMEQSSAAWGSNAWEISYDQDLTLPAGEYVFKVAGRKASGDGCTLSLIVTKGDATLGTVNDFPEGDTGYGIDTNGAANFSDEGTYANEDKGRGWQWRYVKFTLGEAATVNIAVKAKATTNHQWISFCDATVQMTEETYLEANKGGLDAPTAAAEALVDTKPMGTVENEALQAALDMPVTTGAQLLAKIEALNTAVANANAWVVEYNNAKVQLVEALERFEADYNKDDVKMSKEAWNNVLEKVKAAALAKDVTDSYADFEAAANNLNAALDEADESIEAYVQLKTAIDAANTAANGANIGDAPFQRPVSAQAALKDAIATAQTAYDKAEADATEVKNTLATAVEAFNNAELNKPEEGQRFYIKVATEGHGKYGNAWLMTLGATSENNPAGYGINASNEVKPHLNQAFIFTQVEGNLYNISIERAEGTVYLTYGSLNGSAAGWSKQQIQATTNAENKGEFKIEATAKEGVLKIFNTVDNNYIDCQGGGAIYTDTNIDNEEFTFELASESTVNLKFSSVGWATLILPFNATLPKGVKALSCGEADGETLTLIEAENIKANTPYLMNGYEGTHVFSGYGMAEKDSYTDGLFVGTYEEYKTTANSNTYVLQNHDGEVAFYLVGSGENGQPTVGAYRCYMVYDGIAAAPAMFSLGRGGDTTSIDNSQFTIDNSELMIYDLMGRRVTTMEKGGMYIVNGKKVVVK